MKKRAGDAQDLLDDEMRAEGADRERRRIRRALGEARAMLGNFSLVRSVSEVAADLRVVGSIIDAATKSRGRKGTK